MGLVSKVLVAEMENQMGMIALADRKNDCTCVLGEAIVTDAFLINQTKQIVPTTQLELHYWICIYAKKTNSSLQKTHWS